MDHIKIATEYAYLNGFVLTLMIGAIKVFDPVTENTAIVTFEKIENGQKNPIVSMMKRMGNKPDTGECDEASA
jgi:hypothetical protein